MHLLGLKNVQRCPFKGIAPGTSCCTPKGYLLILTTLFFLCEGTRENTELKKTTKLEVKADHVDGRGGKN